MLEQGNAGITGKEDTKRYVVSGSDLYPTFHYSTFPIFQSFHDSIIPIKKKGEPYGSVF
jgi:hypothetical protein